MKSFIVAALMASTVIAADAATTKDAAKTAAVGRALGQPCNGKENDQGCAEGLRCHTNANPTKKLPETLAKEAADKKAAEAAAKKLDDAYAAKDKDNKKKMEEWNALASTKTYLADFKAYETDKTRFDKETADAKKNNDDYKGKDYKADGEKCAKDLKGSAV